MIQAVDLALLIILLLDKNFLIMKWLYKKILELDFNISNNKEDNIKSIKNNDIYIN